MRHLTRQVMVDIYDCPFDRLNNPEFLDNLLLELAEIIDTEAIKGVSHQFSPQGVTAVLIVGASHLLFHTWPEHGVALLDIMAYGQFDVDAIKNKLQERLEGTCDNFIECYRGIMPAGAQDNVQAA